MRVTKLLSLALATAAVSCTPAATPPPAVEPPAPGPAAPAAASGDDAPNSATRTKEAAGGNVVLAGTPEIPEELKRRLGQYVNTRSASLNSLSDDGKAMLVTTRFARTFQLHLVQTPGGARHQLTFENEPVRSAKFVPGSSRAALYMSDLGGNEQYQIFRFDLDTGKRQLLTDGKSRHGNYVWSDDGKQIAYNGNGRNGTDMDLYLGDGKSSGKLLLERSGYWYPIEFSRDGKKLLVGEYISINDSPLYIVDVATKAVTRITPETPKASYRTAAFDRTGNRLYVATDREGEFNELYELDLAKKEWKPLTRDLKWNVEGLALSPDGGTLAFVTNEEGYGVVRLLNTRTRTHRAARGLPKGLVRGFRYARRSNVLGMTLAGSDTPGDAFTYDPPLGKLTRWTESETGGLDPKGFVHPELIRYETFDGKKIPAFYYKPEGKGPFPVLVRIHGGPEAQARPYFNPMLQYLVRESKVAVLVPNVRGSDGYGKSYLLLDNGFKREDSVKDIGSLLDWVAKQPDLDASRTAVYGGSYGGYMVLASLVHFGDRLRAGVDIVGISNFVTFLKNTKPYRRDLRRAEYGDERDQKMHDFLQKISPANNAEKIKSALFVAHGANDPRVPVGETDQIVEAVRGQGNDVWYMVAKNEGHGFGKKENRDLFFQLTVKFLEEKLGVSP